MLLFGVVIGYEFKDRVFDDADLWPLGTDVRDWYFTSQWRLLKLLRITCTVFNLG